jgi:hypothetical protein
MYKAKCAECDAHWNSKAFKSRPSGREIPPLDERGLLFAFASDSNDKICHACYLKNQRLRKGNSLKSLRIGENIDTDTTLLLESYLPRIVLEQEGIAIAALCLLSQNASLQ